MSDLENAQTDTPLPTQPENSTSPVARDAGETADATVGASASTLLEFPGPNRNRPAWRKELSERVREIQQRRAREAALEAEEAARKQTEIASAANIADDALSVMTTKAEERARQLGLVPPPPDMPEMNPIVAAALKRIERARTHAASAPRGRAHGSSHAATAVARVAEERYEPAVESPPLPVKSARNEVIKPAHVSEQAVPKDEPKPDAARLPSLVAVPPKQPVADEPAETKAKTPDEPAPNTSSTKAVVIPPPPMSAPLEKRAADAKADAAPNSVAASVPAPDKPQPRHVAGVIDDHWLERHGNDSLPKVVTTKELYDDRGSFGARFAGAVVDLLVVGFLSAPFAAIIELSIGDWGDPRVQASMSGIVLVVMFLYLTCSTALAGRTWGMSLFSLHTVDANTALAPTTSQCVRRTLVYMLSLATFGLGLLYALFDAEGRTAHDILSRTAIVKE